MMKRRPTVAEAVARLYAQVDAAWAALPPKRIRKPSIPRMVAAAEKTGKSVTSITLPDGTVLHFGEPEPTEATNPWPLDRFQGDKQ